MDEYVGPNLSHPDSTIRLVSAVHRFRCPEMGALKKVSYRRAFKTCGGHSRTKALLEKADASRASVAGALIVSQQTVNENDDSVVRATSEYLPIMGQLLLSCKIQPETARLDEKLLYEWSSGIEKVKKFFRSEALMYELVMVMASNALGNAGVACRDSVNGDFAAASRGFKKSAGMMQFLAEDLLPKWIANGTGIEDKQLPAEANVGVCDSFHTYFLAVGQQMAVSTLLIKPGTPNYSLLAKLCLGVCELLEKFMTAIRTGKAAAKMDLIDSVFFTLVSFQIKFQRALSTYFLSRSIWEKKEEYGLAISMLKDAMALLKAIPEIDAKSPLKMLKEDIKDFKKHNSILLAEWEKDNCTVYFDRVFPAVPENRKLQKGVIMMKPEQFVMEDDDPVPFGHFKTDHAQDIEMARQMQDEEMARTIQKRLNMK